MTTVFKVTKYDCASCAMMMEGVCEDTAGVTKAEVHVGNKTLTVEHDPSVDLEKLRTALAHEGYPVDFQ